MMLRLLVVAMVFCSFSSFSQVVYAQAAAEKPAEKASQEDLAKAQTRALHSQVKNTMSKLEIDEVQHFGVMYSNYLIYSMVKAVREDVGNAVTACSENNKDMASELDAKFAAWEKSVGGTLEEANSNLNNMALAQNYMSQDEVKTLFGLADETRRVNSSRFETTPVSSPEACEFMMSKMDETEQSMNHMLQTTLVSYPTILKKNQK
ncbi:MAG: hypothetical protein ACRBDI_05035 [Alphaproteobacteria bacterium]